MSLAVSLALAALVAGSSPIPMSSSWVSADVHTGILSADSKPGCVPVEVPLLSVHWIQIATGTMEIEERRDLDLVVSAYLQQTKSATSRTESLEALIPLLEYRSRWRRDIDRTWFDFDGNTVTSAFVVDAVTGGILFVVSDETTGLTFSLSLHNEDEQAWQSQRKTIGELARTIDSEKRDSLVDEINDPAVNRIVVSLSIGGGERRFLANPGEDGALDSQLHASLMELWGQTQRGEGRERLRVAMGILALADVDPADTAGRKLGFPPMLDVSHVVSDCLMQAGFRFEDVKSGGGPLHYGGLPSEVEKEHRRLGELESPDPEWTFSKLVEKLH